MLHEVGHLRRADDWINLLQKVSLVVFPLNPVLIWIERRLCLERELACDDAVLRMTKAPKAYATCLTNLAEHRLGRRAAALSLGAWERKSELARRVHRILRGGEGMGRTQARVVMGVLVSGVAGRIGGVGAVSADCFVFAGGVACGCGCGTLGIRAGYQAVAFHERSGLVGAPHETLLKASMPVNPGAGVVGSTKLPKVSVNKIVRKQHSVPPVLQSRVSLQQMRRAERFVVLTSWNPMGQETEMPRVGVCCDRGGV